MKKSVVTTLFYTLFLLFGHGGNNSANAQTGLNPYDGEGMNGGIKFAGCDYGAITDKVNLNNVRDALNKY